MPVRRTPTGFPLVCPTREAAEREIAETIMERMRLFLSAEATLEEAMEMGEYIVDVTVLPDGSVVDESDNYFPVINPQQKV